MGREGPGLVRITGQAMSEPLQPGTSTKVKDAFVNVKGRTLSTVKKARSLSLSDWGSIASLGAIGLWLFDHARRKQRIMR